MGVEGSFALCCDFAVSRHLGTRLWLCALCLPRYQRDVAFYPGHLIAVNREYICYAIRGPLVRVINRRTVERVLLRGHSETIVDMSVRLKIEPPFPYRVAPSLWLW